MYLEIFFLKLVTDNQYYEEQSEATGDSSYQAAGGSSSATLSSAASLADVEYDDSQTHNSSALGIKTKGRPQGKLLS
jgi:hypothetical protein